MLSTHTKAATEKHSKVLSHSVTRTCSFLGCCLYVQESSHTIMSTIKGPLFNTARARHAIISWPIKLRHATCHNCRMNSKQCISRHWYIARTSLQSYKIKGQGHCIHSIHRCCLPKATKDSATQHAIRGQRLVQKLSALS